MTRRRRPFAGTAVVVVAALAGVAAACGVPTDDQPVGVPDGDVPFNLLGTGTTTPPPTAAGPTAGVCFVRDGNVWALDVPVPPAGAPADRLTAATGVRPAGYATALDPESVTGVRVTGETATVSLGTAFRDRTARDQQLAVAQITCTLTLDPAVRRVLFTVDGAAVEVPRGNGSTTAEAVTRDDYRSMIVDPGTTPATGPGG